MSAQSFVVRVLDDDNRLLAWRRLEIEPSRGVLSVPSTIFTVEQAGRASKLSVHWLDLDVSRVEKFLAPIDVEAGQEAAYIWLGPVWKVHGQENVPLPAVTERRHVTISVPTGTLGAVGLT